MSDPSEERRELVFALCHEIGNLVAAIRLEAHLIDPDEGPLEVARSSIAIEDLTARVGALLAQVQTLLAPPQPGAPGRVDPAALLAHLEEALRGVGGPGARTKVALGTGLPRVVGDPERIHTLLVLLGLGALESAAKEAVVEVRARAGAGGKEVSIELAYAGPPEPELTDWRSAARRGLPLVLQVADAVVRPLGGSIDQGRSGDRNRTVLRLPAAPHSQP